MYSLQATSSSVRGNRRQLYIWPTIPQPAQNPADATPERPFDVNSTFNFWSISTSHVHVILGGVPRNPNNTLDVSNGVMTINLVTGGEQDGTPIWHPKVQFPPVQPSDVASVREALAERGMAADQHPPGDQENMEIQEVNQFMPVQALNSRNMQTIMIDRILMDAVQFHIIRDGNPAPWRTLVNPGTRKWSPKGVRYRDEWQGLMRAVDRMCTEWWGANYYFPFTPAFAPREWQPLPQGSPITPPRQPGQQQQEEGGQVLTEDEFPPLGGPATPPAGRGAPRGGRGAPRGRGGALPAG
jgi:hypothetical protein